LQQTPDLLSPPKKPAIAATSTRFISKASSTHAPSGSPSSSSLSHASSSSASSSSASKNNHHRATDLKEYIASEGFDRFAADASAFAAVPVSRNSSPDKLTEDVKSGGNGNGPIKSSSNITNSLLATSASSKTDVISFSSSSSSSSSDSSSLLSPLKRLLGSAHSLDADEVALVAKLVEEATAIPVSTSVLAAPPPPPPGPPPADAMRMTPISSDLDSPQTQGAHASTLLALEAAEMRVSVLDAKLKQQMEERIEENNERNALVESLTSELEQLRSHLEKERKMHAESTTQMRKDFEAELADVAKRPSKTQMEHLRSLSEQLVEVEGERARLFVAEASVRRDLEALRSSSDDERSQWEKEKLRLEHLIETEKKHVEVAIARTAAVEADLAAVKARAQSTVTTQTREYEAEIQNLKRMHKEELDSIRSNAIGVAAHAAEAAGFRELRSPTKGRLLVRQFFEGGQANLGYLASIPQEGQEDMDDEQAAGYADILDALAAEVSTLRTELAAARAEAKKNISDGRKVAETEAERDALKSERQGWFDKVKHSNEQLVVILKEARSSKENLMAELAALSAERNFIEQSRKVQEERESILIDELVKRHIATPRLPAHPTVAGK
jgi:hypothetical protein